jgi:hypothetical protein
MKTAVQELKSDLLIAVSTCNEALEEIKDLRTREACQAVVNLTIDNILNRIDTELLEMEKEQIKNAYEKGKKYKKPIKDSNPIWLNSKPYKDKIKDKVNNYRNNFKSE